MCYTVGEESSFCLSCFLKMKSLGEISGGKKISLKVFQRMRLVLFYIFLNVNKFHEEAKTNRVLLLLVWDFSWDLLTGTQILTLSANESFVEI